MNGKGGSLSAVVVLSIAAFCIPETQGFSLAGVNFSPSSSTSGCTSGCTTFRSGPENDAWTTRGRGGSMLYLRKIGKKKQRILDNAAEQIALDDSNMEQGRQWAEGYESSVFEVGDGPEGGEGLRMDAFLGLKVPEQSRSYFGTLCHGGHVRVDGKPIKKSAKTESGMKVEVRFSPSPEMVLDAEDVPLDILFEDKDLVVVNKPEGMVVHPAPGNWNGTFVNGLLHHLQIDNAKDFGAQGGSPSEVEQLRPGVVHRLDKGTTGVLLAAKNPNMQAKLCALFAERKVEKAYLAIVAGNPGEDAVMDVPIARHPRNRQKMVAVNADIVTVGLSGQRNALSIANTLAHDGKCSVVHVRIETGRTHQIRVHLQDRHTPVIGDELYGSSDWNKKVKKQYGISRPLLHAHTLEFEHPNTGQNMRFVAPLAPDMLKVARSIYPTLDADHPDWVSAGQKDDGGDAFLADDQALSPAAQKGVMEGEELIVHGA